MVGCVEDCIPPLLNIVGNNGYTDDCGAQSTGGILTPDMYGDLGQITVSVGRVWDAAHPLTITAPVRAVPRGGVIPLNAMPPIPYLYGGLQLSIDVSASSLTLNGQVPGDTTASIVAPGGAVWIAATRSASQVSMSTLPGTAIGVPILAVPADESTVTGFGQAMIRAFTDVGSTLTPLDAGTLNLSVGFPAAAPTGAAATVVSATLSVFMGNCG